MTIQTAFRFEETTIRLMKQRAKNKRQSLNAYVTELIEADLHNASFLPTVTMPAEPDKDISAHAGSIRIPETAMLTEDERLGSIWER